MNDPLIIFWSFRARDAFKLGLNLIQETDDPIELPNNHQIYMYTLQTNKTLYMTVCRAPNGTAGFKAKAEELYAHFRGPIFIFHRDLVVTAADRQFHNVFINYPLQVVLSILDVFVNDQDMSRMVAALGLPLRRQLFPDPFFAPPLPPPPQAAAEVAHNDDEELQRALRASEEEHARALAAQAPPQITREMDAVLKLPELAKPGDPLCAVCSEYKATICIVKCGHQALCDECVPQLVKRECVICRVEFGPIVRPFWSHVKAPNSPPERAASLGDGEEAPPRPAHGPDGAAEVEEAPNPPPPDSPPVRAASLGNKRRKLSIKKL